MTAIELSKDMKCSWQVHQQHFLNFFPTNFMIRATRSTNNKYLFNNIVNITGEGEQPTIMNYCKIFTIPFEN